MSLYLKYRPQSFQALSGQQHIKRTLQKGIELERLAHAYLFCGPRGTGKTTTARLIAKSVNCTNFDKKNIEPCNECDMCKEINDGSLVDVIEIDAASNRGIDEIRELRDSVQFNPYHAENKVYIIDEVHMLTKEAFNALLKTLEEPPANVYFILATTEVHKIPDTIISRCQRYDFKRIMEVDILDRIAYINKEESFGIEEDSLKIVVRKAKGGMRDAISLLDQVSASGLKAKEDVSQVLGVTPEDELVNLIELALAGDVLKATEKVVNINNYGYGSQQINLDMASLLRDRIQRAVFENDTSAQSQFVFLMESWQKIWNVFKESSITSLPLEVFVVKTANHFAGININVPAPSKIAQAKELLVEAEPVNNKNVEEASVKKEVKAKPVVEDSKIKDIMASGDIKIKQKKTETVKEVVDKVELGKADLSGWNQKKLDEMWVATVNNLKTAMIKTSLQATKLKVVDGGILISFNSNFPHGQASKPEYANEINKALEEKLGGKVDIEMIVDVSLAAGLRKSKGMKVKHNAFDLDPSTGEPDIALTEEDPNNGLSVDEVASFFS